MWVPFTVDRRPFTDTEYSLSFFTQTQRSTLGVYGFLVHRSMLYASNSSYETSRLSVIPSADKELTRNPPSAQYFNRHSREGGNPVL